MHSKSEPWHPVRGGFAVQSGQLQGRVSLRDAAPGFRQLALISGRRPLLRRTLPLLSIWRAVASGMPPIPVRGGAEPLVSRVRGTMLDVRLGSLPASSVRLHLYWQVSSERQVDLEVLADTTDPVRRIEVLTLSSHRESDLLVPLPRRGSGWVNLRDAARFGTDYLVLPRDRDSVAMTLDDRWPPAQETVLSPAFRYPLVLCRPQGTNWSYVEFCHSDDCARIIARLHARGVDVSFGLFGLDLEKGVVLRGRVRGAFLPRRGDIQLALRLFQRFRREPPHLSV